MKILAMFSAANAALALGLLWLGQAPEAETLPARAERDLPVVAVPASVSPPAPGLSDRDIARASKLFGPSRIAAAPAAAPDVQPTPVEAPAAPAPAIELVGVLLGDASRVALIRHGEPPEVRRVSLGAAVGKWQVVRIDMRSVILREGAEEIELKLDAVLAK